MPLPTHSRVLYNGLGVRKRATRAIRLAAVTPLLCAVVAASLALVVARSASASSLDLESADWDGLADLIALARSEDGYDRVVTPRKVDLEALSPEDALLVIHPETQLDPSELESFMSAGGRVGLLDDYGTGTELLEHFGVRRVPLPANPAQMLRSNPAFALAEVPATTALWPDTLSGLRGGTPVVTNHATGLADTGLLALLVVHGRTEPDVTLAVAGAVGQGRLLAVGDSSVVMNAMLRYPGNRALAIALVRYLSAGAHATSSNPGRLIIIANGTSVTGEFGGPTPLPKPLHGALVDTLDALKHGLPPNATYAVALAVGLGIILWASSRAGRTYKESLPRFVRPTPVAAQGGLAGQTALLVSGSPRRALVELRRALEEQVGLRLGLERPAPHRELVARARARGILGESDAQDLEELFATLRLEGDEPRLQPWKRLKRERIVALVEHSRDLLAAMDAGRRDRMAASP